MLTTLAVQYPASSHGYVPAARTIPFKYNHELSNAQALSILFSSTSEDSDPNLESADLRREQQYIKYKALSAVWLIEPLVKEWIPFRVIAEHTRGDLFLLPKVGYTMGMWLAAGLSSILASATFNDRLSSDTYKRLNLVLLGFSFMTLSTFLDNVYYVTPAAGIVGIFAAYDGFVNGVRGFHSQAEDASYNGIGDVISECKSGIMETASGMFKAKNARAFGYLMIIWLFTLVNVFHNVPLFFKLLFYSSDMVKTGSMASTIARLFVISGMSFTLKDAADRSRLNGGTFIQLNALAGTWATAVSLAALLPKYMGSRFGLVSDKAVKTASVLFPIGAYFFWNGIKEQIKKTKS